MFKDNFELQLRCGFSNKWIQIGNNIHVEDLEKRKAIIDSRRALEKESRWIDSRIIKVSRVIYA